MRMIWLTFTICEKGIKKKGIERENEKKWWRDKERAERQGKKIGRQRVSVISVGVRMEGGLQVYICEGRARVKKEVEISKRKLRRKKEKQKRKRIFNLTLQ